MSFNKTTYQNHIHLLVILCISSVFLLFIGCANPGTPTGGKKDKTSPGIDSTKSTPSPSTNFNDDRIKITFDEWVKLDNANSQLVISPPLKNNPEIKLKGKTVELIFKDSLRENTTYAVYFGDAIKDITEGNVAKNVNVTFSTGPFLDSLETRGNVKNAFTGDRVENMLVMLYPANATDSIVFKEKPLYLSKTEADGTFIIKNLKSGDYKIFALEDNNFNYLYDDGEAIGFMKAPLTISDSVSANVQLLVFTEEQPTSVRGVSNKNYGKTRIAFNKPPEDINIEVLNQPELSYYTEVVKDSIWFWYENVEENLTLLIKEKTTVLDTLEIKPTSMASFLKKNADKLDFDRSSPSSIGRPPSAKGGLGKPGINTPNIPEATMFEKARQKALKKKLFANKKEYLFFNFPLKTIDASKIKVIEDTTGLAVTTASVVLSDSVQRALEITHKWKAENSYSIIFEPGALTSFYNFKNDSLILEVIGKSTEDFGSVSLIVEGLMPENSHILSVLNRLEEVIFEVKISGVATYEKEIKDVEPASGYKVRLIEDTNNNGKWDPGDYLLKRAPERILIQPLQTVKPNWEVEGKINFSQKKQEKPTSLQK